MTSGVDIVIDSGLDDDSFLIGNATAINVPPGAGYVSVYGGDFGGTSTVNTSGVATMPNLFIVDPASDGSITARVGGGSERHVIVDSVARLKKNPATVIYPSPRRVLDSRVAGLAVVPDGELTVDLGERYAGRLAIINLTVDRTAAPGWQATYPCADGYQGTSSINLRGGG
ncbi:MAG: hypothetical protein AAFY28_18290, partial [Actinomycetota bacterium]